MGARLFDGSATFDYTTNGTGPLPIMPPTGSGTRSMNFQLSGFPGDPTERQVFAGNWWYRVQGDARERYLGNPVTRIHSAPDYALWRFDSVYTQQTAFNPLINVEMDFGVTSYNPDSAALRTGLCFFNYDTSPLFVEAFFALDIDLAATPGGDIYLPMSTALGGRLLTMVDGSYIGALYGSTAIGSGQDEISTIFGQLNNALVDNFVPDINPGGATPVDGGAVLQWSFHVDPGATPVCVPAIFAIGRNGEQPVVPEPMLPAWISLLGMLILARRSQGLRGPSRPVLLAAIIALGCSASLNCQAAPTFFVTQGTTLYRFQNTASVQTFPLSDTINGMTTVPAGMNVGNLNGGASGGDVLALGTTNVYRLDNALGTGPVLTQVGVRGGINASPVFVGNRLFGIGGDLPAGSYLVEWDPANFSEINRWATGVFGGPGGLAHIGNNDFLYQEFNTSTLWRYTLGNTTSTAVGPLPAHDYNALELYQGTLYTSMALRPAGSGNFVVGTLGQTDASFTQLAILGTYGAGITGLAIVPEPASAVSMATFLLAVFGGQGFNRRARAVAKCRHSARPW